MLFLLFPWVGCAGSSGWLFDRSGGDWNWNSKEPYIWRGSRFDVACSWCCFSCVSAAASAAVPACVFYLMPMMHDECADAKERTNPVVCARTHTHTHTHTHTRRRGTQVHAYTWFVDERCEKTKHADVGRLVSK